MDEQIARAAQRVAWASRACEEAADDLFRAARRGLLVNGPGMHLEAEASRLESSPPRSTRCRRSQVRRSSLLTPAWRVEVAEHDVPPRWHIPAQVVKLCAP